MTASGMTAVGARDAPTAPRRRLGRGRDRGLMLLVAPSLLWYVVFTIGPLLAMFYIAFFDWKGLASQPRWTGLDNLRLLFTDPRITTAAWNTFIHLLFTLPVMMVGS